VWKLNATWPHIYSNIIDYYLEPYIPFYELKRAYEPVLLSFDIGDHIWLWLVNDSDTVVEGTYRVGVYDVMHDTTVAETSGDAHAAPGTSFELTDLNSFGQFDKAHVLYAELVDAAGTVAARTVDYVAPERYLVFPEAHLKIETVGESIVVSTDRFARCVELTGNDDGNEFGWLFSDNYFDLMPWERKVVGVGGAHHGGTLSAKPFFSSGTESVVWTPERG